MPTYEYECSDCGHRFEAFQSITASPISECEACGGNVRRVVFPVGIVFKGSGFHVNDYPSSSSASTKLPNKADNENKKESGAEESTTTPKEPAASATK